MTRTDGGRGGFTLLELLVVLLLLALLSAIAIPNFQQAVLRARAAEAVGDMHVVRTALVQYPADLAGYPPDRGLGQVPPELVPYLPDEFSFAGEGYALDYDNWLGAVAVSVVTEDPRLAQAILSLLGNNALGGSLPNWATLIVDWTE